jgi:UDP-N-acetylmuramoyl-tripeptide--D-alanyl-D-alanine ligase
MSTAQIYQEFLLSTGICTDTRQEIQGKLFFALKGDQFDGNRFVEDALKKGCRLAITERKDLKGSERILAVPSVLELLQNLAQHHRMQVAPKVLAITGSNGKTTTKELIAAVLSTAYELLATRGNLNNHIGVPLTLLRLNMEELAVVEMGANHPGEIAELARIAAPNVGVITNVGKAHLEGFGSLEGVLNAKSELYAYLAAHGGKALIDGGDPILRRKADELGVAYELIAPGEDLNVSVKLLKQNPKLEIELSVGDEIHSFSTGLVGAYNLQNILFAAACGVHFGVSGASIAAAISGYIPENQRSQMIEGGRNRVVLDSYNANPSSMREAIQGFLSYGKSPLMLVLGDMAELGDSSEQEHRELLDWIASLGVDRVMLAGPNFYQVHEPSGRISAFMTRGELETQLKKEKPGGYHILVKGSRIMELERLGPLLVNS